MKRISKGLLFIFILILGISISVYAEDANNIESNKLASIKLDGHELEFFNEDVNNYEITVESDVSKINITATKKDDKAEVTGDIGEKKLDYGLNKFSIKVSSNSGNENIYHLDITREDARSDNNTLKSLTLSTGDIKFKSDVTSYSINVDNNVEKITIKSELSDIKSRYVEDYRNKEIELVEGSNKVEIKIISEKGDIKIYTLNINRALSGNNSLKSLKVNDDKIKLVENEFIYDVTVENEVSEVAIDVVTNDTKATVNLEDKYELQVGINEIKIKVIAANGSEASYILNITRKKILSRDSLLTNIRIKGYDLNFKQDVKVYNLKINDEESLEISTLKEDENAVVEIEGNKDLIDGSIIKINVKAEDGSFTRYFINIEKKKKGISPVLIILIVLFILLGGCIGLILYRKNKKDKKEFSTKDFEKSETKEIVEIPSDENKIKDTYIGAHEMTDEASDNETIDKEKDI